jgi:2-polyprenyl-6-methoxyphenol hydroxylase-like FAD-dependent oxidoreductase
LSAQGQPGAALAYLLARRGVAVTLLEKHLDFAGAFRAEGLQPSGVDALVQMGFAEKLALLPQAKVNVSELRRGGRLRARINTAQLGFIALFVSQPALLEMLTKQGGLAPGLQLEMGACVRQLVHEGERAVGVRADTVKGIRNYRADLVVGTDGRHSITRKDGGFTELTVRQNFDVVWFKVPFPDFWPDRATVRLEPREVSHSCDAGAPAGGVSAPPKTLVLFQEMQRARDVGVDEILPVVCGDVGFMQGRSA